MLIPSGSLTPGISPADFNLPPNTALRYERPAPSLRRHLASYVVMDSTPGGATGGIEWMLPNWAQIWIVMTREANNVGIGNRKYASLPPAVLYGVTSRAMPISARGGVTIGIDLSPLGWARLIGQSAETLRDQIAPLDAVMRFELVAELSSALASSDRALGVKDVLDDFFLRRMSTPHRDEPRIARVMSLIEDENTTDLATAAAVHGIDKRVASSLSRYYFGFPPKLLMMRTRFLRAFVPMLDSDPDAEPMIPTGYFDQSHFLRDAKRFLGMTPRQFIAQKSPYAAAARRARRAVIGAPVPPLDQLALLE